MKNAACPGGEGAVLKTVGLKGLAGSNPVYGAQLYVYKLSALRADAFMCIE